MQGTSGSARGEKWTGLTIVTRGKVAQGKNNTEFVLNEYISGVGMSMVTEFFSPTSFLACELARSSDIILFFLGSVITEYGDNQLVDPAE